MKTTVLWCTTVDPSVFRLETLNVEVYSLQTVRPSVSPNVGPCLIIVRPPRDHLTEYTSHTIPQSLLNTPRNT